MQSSKPILLVEDDSVDAMTVKRALKELNRPNLLIHKTNGQEALEYLRDEGNERPYIILLDLNMPKMNGIEFLKIIKADDALKSIPVVVLSTSNEECDMAESFKLNVTGYVVKQIDCKKFVETIRTIDHYWSLSEMPKEERNHE